MSDAWIVDAVRTPMGRHGGQLAPVRPDDLAAHVLASVIGRSAASPDAIDDIYFGCTNGVGEDSRNVARMAVLLAGLPHSVPGATINRLCGSGMEAVIVAARALRGAEGDLLVAGGVESMTRAPWAVAKPDRPWPVRGGELVDTTIGWRFVNPRMKDFASTASMGETAENVASHYRVSRAEQDKFALRSHSRAVAAQRAGNFDREIVAVDVPQTRSAAVRVGEDEGPRRGLDDRAADAAATGLSGGRLGDSGELLAAQ